MLCQFLPRSGTRDGSEGRASSMLSRRAVILGADQSTSGNGCSATRKKSFPIPSGAKDSPGHQTDQKATKSVHPQPLSPNQDRDNPGKIAINQLMRIAVFPRQGSSWLNNSLYPPISLHHLSSSFKSTQYFLNPQVLTGSKKKKGKTPRRKVLMTH